MPAFFYTKNAYDTGGTRLVGLQAANRHFPDALLRDEAVDDVGCYVAEPRTFEEFSVAITPVKPATKTITHIPFGDHAALGRAGTLHKPDPTIAPLLWQRRSADQRLYSVVGIIHSISALHIMESIGDVVVVPFQPWDALICTSQAGKDALTTMLGNWAEYLAQRFNATPQLNITLPLIPLGIDCDVFDAESAASDARTRVRAELGIGESDVAVLFVGRLTYRRKTHPVPMYLALQKAQEATGARLHFIQAGQFEDPDEEALFQQAAEQFAPNVRTLVVGGRELFRDHGVWSAGDIFLSLSDNIQETFGLSPVEAMAAGLPVVVSDWDGYRDTVRDGVDGFRIPTRMPPAPNGLSIAEHYHLHGNFRHYYGTVAMNTAVDLDACAGAWVQAGASGRATPMTGARS